MDKILIVEVAGIGDAVMSVPCLRALRRQYPSSYIAALVSRRAAALLKGCPYTDEVLTVAGGILPAIRALRAKRFDLAVNLYRIASRTGALKMNLFFKLIAPGLSLGRNTDSRGTFYDRSVDESFNAPLHEVEEKLRVIELLGIDVEDRGLELWPGSEAEEYASKVFKESGLNQGDLLVGINPNANQKGNLWYEDRFAGLSDALIERFKAKVIFFGSLGDRKRVSKIISLMKNKPVDLCGKAGLEQYPSLLKRLTIFITLDSGPMHVAGVFKVPTIALFGGERPEKFRPYGNDKAVVLQKKVLCSPCRKKFHCGSRLCMEAIGVNDVIGVFEELKGRL